MLAVQSPASGGPRTRDPIGRPPDAGLTMLERGQLEFENQPGVSIELASLLASQNLKKRAPSQGGPRRRVALSPLFGEANTGLSRKTRPAQKCGEVLYGEQLAHLPVDCLIQ